MSASTVKPWIFNVFDSKAMHIIIIFLEGAPPAQTRPNDKHPSKKMFGRVSRKNAGSGNMRKHRLMHGLLWCSIN